MNSFQNNPLSDTVHFDEHVYDLIRQIDAAEANMDWTLVESLSKQYLQHDANNLQVWQKLANSYEKRSDLFQAETLWRHLTQRFSNRSEPYLALAALQRRRGASDSARVVLEEAERKVGVSTDLKTALSIIDDPWQAGVDLPILSISSSPADLAHAIQLVNDSLLVGKFSEAEAILSQLLSLKPFSAKIHFKLAELRWRRDDLSNLISQLQPLFSNGDKMFSLDEALPLFLLLVKALLSQLCFDEANQLFESFVSSYPSFLNIDFMILRAETLIKCGVDLGAQQLLSDCLDLQPNQSRANYLLGEIYLRFAEYDLAITYLSKALALQPLDAEITSSLEQAREQKLWWQGEDALNRCSWQEAGLAYRQLLKKPAWHADALSRLDLLASLDINNLFSNERDVILYSPQLARTIQFRGFLDRTESQLKMLGVPISD